MTPPFKPSVHLFTLPLTDTPFPRHEAAKLLRFWRASSIPIRTTRRHTSVIYSHLNLNLLTPRFK